ncbi:MAG: outer membrane lipoprotein carrier protein LolA [Acidobacteriota bacterium]
MLKFEIFARALRVAPAMSPSRLTAFLLTATLATASFAASGPKGVTLDTVIRKVAEKQKSTRTLQADFRQEKTLGMLARPEVSSGTFLYSSPNSVLWTYDQPKPVVMVIANGWLTTYYPELKKAEKVEVKRYEDRIFKYLGASGAIDELGKYFNFRFVDAKSDPFLRLDLDPKTQAIARRVKHLTIWIDRQSYLTTKFEYVEGDGDVTRYEFSNLRINSPVPAAKFTLQLPPSVKIEQMRLN